MYVTVNLFKGHILFNFTMFRILTEEFITVIIYSASYIPKQSHFWASVKDLYLQDSETQEKDKCCLTKIVHTCSKMTLSYPKQLKYLLRKHIHVNLCFTESLINSKIPPVWGSPLDFQCKEDFSS